MQKYIIRLDDACQTMNQARWDAILKILDKYNIKAIIAVIPNNKDKTFAGDKISDESFYES